jgi:hypothetical protein
MQIAMQAEIFIGKQRINPFMEATRIIVAPVDFLELDFDTQPIPLKPLTNETNERESAGSV